MAIQVDVPLVAGIHASQHVEHSGFSGAGRTHDDAKFSLIHIEADVIRCGNAVFSHGVVLAHVLKFDEMRHSNSPLLQNLIESTFSLVLLCEIYGYNL